MNEGTLGLLAGTHKLDFSQEWEVEELPLSFIDVVDNLEIFTNKFQVGDFVIFDIRTIHGSFMNLNPRFRLSTDTRWIIV